MNPIRACVLALFFALALPACARDCTPQVRDGWARLMPMNMPMTAGFGRIENKCPEAVTIVGASSPAFGEVSLHETRIVNGVSQMRAMPELTIAPGQSATLQPGGLHLMLMQPRAPLQEGTRVAVEFKLKDGRTFSAELDVRKAAP